MNEIDLNSITVAIVVVSATVAGISAGFIVSMWNRLKASIRNIESPYPLEAEIARREMHTITFIIIPHVVSIFLLSVNAVFGLIMLGGQIFSPFQRFLILLLFFSTGLYSFLVPFLVVLKDDLYLIKLHEKILRRGLEKEKK